MAWVGLGYGMGGAWLWHGWGLVMAWVGLGYGMGGAWLWHGWGLVMAWVGLRYGMGGAWVWHGWGLGMAWVGLGYGMGGAWLGLGYGMGGAWLWHGWGLVGLGYGMGGAWVWGRGVVTGICTKPFCLKIMFVSVSLWHMCSHVSADPFKSNPLIVGYCGLMAYLLWKEEIRKGEELATPTSGYRGKVSVCL